MLNSRVPKAICYTIELLKYMSRRLLFQLFTECELSITGVNNEMQKCKKFNLTPGASFSSWSMVIRLNHESVLSASGTLI